MAAVALATQGATQGIDNSDTNWLCGIFYFLHAIWCHTIPLKHLSNADFAIVAKDSFFLIEYCDVTTADLWRHANVGIVTSYSSIVLAHANWRKGDLH